MLSHHHRRVYLGLLVVLLWACLAGPASPAGDNSRNIKDFGGDVPVQSVQALAVDDFNAQVQQAVGHGEAWVKEPVLVALRFVGAEIRGHTKIIELRTPPENQDSATVTVTEAGYPDDAVAGARWRLWLAKDTQGIWTLQKALWAQLCSRPGQRFYSAGPCP